MVIEGVPSHAWTRETAADLLGSSCLVKSLAPETANREDLSLFKLRAWCVDPDEVQVDKRIWIPELETTVDPVAPLPTSKLLFEYKTIIHIGRIREHEGPESWLRPPSSNGSDRSGLSDDFSDLSGRESGGSCLGREACVITVAPPCLRELMADLSAKLFLDASGLLIGGSPRW
ncbi:hypothetical protein ZWY2020_041986 [Hordeum vulgare]|nr:hypothetical protein ZWY2020_041986 [Hordeum vulgare]